MKKDIDYKIKKIDTTALQRFKNQNLLLKKYGEIGLQTYKYIDNKKTSEEIRKKVKIKADKFAELLAYMEKAGMIELIAVEEETKKTKKDMNEEDLPDLPEDLKPLKEKEKPPEPEEEIKFEKQKPAPPDDEEEETPQDEEEEKIKFKKQDDEKEKPKPSAEEDEEPEEEIKSISDEIKPIEDDEEPEVVEEKESEEDENKFEKEEEETPQDEEEKPPDEEEEEIKFEKQDDEEEKPKPPAEEDEEPEVVEEEPEEDVEFEPETVDHAITPDEDEEAEETHSDDDETPVEKIIRDKYGEIGFAVYTLIDGQKSAEEIMQETGLTESKLVEILDFMEDQGIIKLEYPGSKKGKEKAEFKPTEEKEKFSPMFDEKAMLSKTPKGMDTVDVPIKVSSDIVKSVQLKARIMFEFGEDGSRIARKIDGKKNVIELTIDTGIPLYKVNKVLNFLLEKNAVMLKALTRQELQKKYGDDVYSIYKRFGRAGVLVYELIGKDFTIKKMAEMVTKDKEEFVEMFLFVHEVLRVPIPIDKELIYKRLGL